MTKKEREAMQAVFNRLTNYREIADEAFEKLQDLNKNIGTGHAWCSAEVNYRDLLSVGKDYTYLYNRYMRAVGMQDAMREVGDALIDVGFWKRNGKE